MAQSNALIHRAGMDALLLAACAPQRGKPRSKDYRIADFGAGCGVVGFACAHLCNDARIDLFEIDREMVARVGRSLELKENRHLADRITVTEAEIGQFEIDHKAYQLVLSNPPFNDNSLRPSPVEKRRIAHDMDDNTLTSWVNSASEALEHKGHLIFILRPASLPKMLQILEEKFGSIGILPVITKPDTPASRIIICARKGGRAALQIHPQLTVHQADGSFTPQADAIFKGKARLNLV